MLDTIKFSLDKSMYWIKDRNQFYSGKVNSSRGFYTRVQNPTKTQLLSGDYRPRLTLTNRFNVSGRSEETLSVELSLPKLLFGNNFDELTDNDFTQVCLKLQQVLDSMGVKVFSEILVSAPVSAIHYSKNINLVDGYTPHFIISKVKEANVSMALDVNQTDFRNDGYSYKWHANSFELIFYDKIKDLETAMHKGDRRAIENDNKVQLGLFDSVKNKQLEVLRIEIRLNNRQKLKQLFNNLKIESDYTFKSLFSANISRKVLLHYLGEVERQRLPIYDYNNQNPKSFLINLIITNPNASPLKLLQTLGLKAALDNTSPRELRAMFGKYSDRNWYRLMSNVKSINFPNVINPFKCLNEQLINFKPMHMVDLNVGMLNNDKNG
jgi:hypothetical protein